MPTWALIRFIGELKILSRISYAALVLVPILAVIWPNARILLNQYNKRLNNTVSIIENMSTNIINESKKFQFLIEQNNKKEAYTSPIKIEKK